jgi:DeoR family transcriptional regulator, fructose operon transcriptional repressor
MTLTGDGQPGLFQSARQNEIYRMTLSQGSVDVSELARHFEVTPETIRRDLSELQARRLLRRVHGGAVAIDRHRHEPMLDARNSQNRAEKLRIAEGALRYVPEAGSVLLDSGSTVQCVADIYPATSSTHVLTNSLTTALSLVRRGVSDVTVIGGAVRTNTFAMVDASVVDAVRQIRADVLFMSCDGFSLSRGLTTPYREEAAVKRAMVDSARWVVALVDHTKFGSDQTYGYLPLDEIDALVIDTGVDDATVERLVAVGIEVSRA